MSKPPTERPDGSDRPTDPAEELADERRRAFLKQAGVVVGVGATAGWAALAPADWPLSLRDPDGERGKPKARVLSLPQGGFAVAPSPLAAQLGVARGTTVRSLVRASVDAIGGIGRFIERGQIQPFHAAGGGDETDDDLASGGCQGAHAAAC